MQRKKNIRASEAGLDSPQAILDMGWDGLVDLLDRAHYVRYDFSTATKLLDVSNLLIVRYGTLKQMITQSATPAELAKMLQEFKGIGPVTAAIFVREIRPFWNFFKRERMKQTGRHDMNREPRRIPPKFLATTQKRRSTREVAALPKGSKEALRKGRKGKIIPLSPSQPHSKSFGR